MSIDLENLTPVPWTSVRQFGAEPPYRCVIANNMDAFAMVEREADADFIALARDAFDVMMRRGWQVMSIDGRWHVHDGVDGNSYLWIGGVGAYPIPADPFTALVEADKWYRENVEGKP